MHWLLGQLRRCDDGDRARLENDPWRDLAAWDFSERHAEAGTSPADVNADAWLACDGLPGTRLRWVRTGALRSELRAGGGQVSASVRRRLSWSSWSGQAGVVRVGGRAFTSQRVSRSAWPGIAATFGAGFPAAGEPLRSARDWGTRVLADPFGVPVLRTGGQNFNQRAGAYIRLPGERWFQFPVRGRDRGSGVMTALDQDGDKVAVYRTVGADGGFPGLPQVEIAVHPDQGITDELLLVLAVSAPWLWTYFGQDSGGG